MRFADFSQVQAAQPVNYLDAEMQRARIDSTNQQRKYQQRQNLGAGAITAYDKFTGEDTPIRDYTTNLIDSLRGGGGEAMPEPVDMAGPGIDTPGANPGLGKAMAMAGGPGAGSAMAAEQAAGVGETGMDLMGAADAGGDSVADAVAALEGGGPGAAGAMAAEQAAAQGAEAAAAEGGDELLDSVSGVPLVSALRGVGELAEGDIGGAAQTGASAYLSTLGPYGMAAGLLMNLLG